MIKWLQVKIITVILGTLLLVFIAVLAVLNISVYQTSIQRAEDFLNLVIENDGFLFPLIDTPLTDTPMPIPDMNRPIPDINKPNPDMNGSHPGMNASHPSMNASHPNMNRPNSAMMRGGRFFYVKLDRDGGIFEENMLLMIDFGANDAQNYVTSALNTGREKGNIENLSFMIAEKPYGQIIVFVERSIDIHLIEQLNRISMWAAGIVSLILLFFSLFLARWMVAPVKNTFDKQRRFISDASHELKTPLTVISANADLLQNEIGDNQRLANIKAQYERMNGLVHDLLTLAKADEGQTNTVMSNFDLSGAVLNTALESESRAFEEKKKYSYDIKGNIGYIGDEKQIRRLVTILIDNAIHYSDNGGQIKVSLRADGSRIRISVFNTGIGVPDGEYKKIFERFYRTDESRSRETGGYGVGLSIAKAIVETHKGKIAVSGEYMKWIRFDVTL